MITLALFAALAAPADLCSIALSGPFRESTTIDGTCALDRGPWEVCADVVALAGEVGVDPRYALALAFHEGRLRDLPSFKGRDLVRAGRHPDNLPDWVERTTMQCKPRDHCPGGEVKGCDYMRRCMISLKREVDTPRACRHEPQMMTLPVVGEVHTGKFKVACRRVKRGTRSALRESFARYHMPYGPAPAYADGVMRRFDQLNAALHRASTGTTTAAASR